MAERISMRELAEIAGVSRTTVSLALRESVQISKPTRERIAALAKEHGYRSIPSLSALTHQVRRKRASHEIIAFIRSGMDPDEGSPGPLEILEGAREEALHSGYSIEVFWAGYKGAEAERLARILFHRGIRGAIWSPMPYPHPPVHFPWENFASIACTSSIGVPNLPMVRIRHAKGMSRLLEELHRRGARRIGVVIDRNRDARQNYGWSLGVDLYRHRSGLAEVFVRAMDHFEGFDRFPTWITEHAPDALVLAQEYFAASVPVGLTRDIPTVSLDVPKADLGQTAGLFQDMKSIGRQAVQSISGRLRNRNLGLPDQPYALVTEAKFVEGASLLGWRKDEYLNETTPQAWDVDDL